MKLVSLVYEYCKGNQNIINSVLNILFIEKEIFNNDIVGENMGGVIKNKEMR